MISDLLYLNKVKGLGLNEGYKQSRSLIKQYLPVFKKEHQINTEPTVVDLLTFNSLLNNVTCDQITVPNLDLGIANCVTQKAEVVYNMDDNLKLDHAFTVYYPVSKSSIESILKSPNLLNLEQTHSDIFNIELPVQSIYPYGNNSFICLNRDESNNPIGAHSQSLEYDFCHLFTMCLGKATTSSGIFWGQAICRLSSDERNDSDKSKMDIIDNLQGVLTNNNIHESLQRAEVALSPVNEDRDMLVILNTKSFICFVVYKLNTIKDALDWSYTRHLDLSTIDTNQCFVIRTKDLKLFGKNHNILANDRDLSYQGFGIDNQRNLYMVGNMASDTVKNPAYIIKIPFVSDMTKWSVINLRDISYIEHYDSINDDLKKVKNVRLECEGIQVFSENNVLLTVSYHLGDSEFSRSYAFKVNWN